MLKNPRLLLLLAALLIVGGLNYAPFWNPDEGRYASASLEMIGGIEGSRPDWVVPHLNTIPRLNKPPLVYWLAGSAFSVFGPSEWAGRLGPALASLTVMFIIFALGRRMFDEKTGIAGALIWATSLMSTSLGRTCNTDMLLAGGMTIVLWGIWLAVGEDRGVILKESPAHGDSSGRCSFLNRPICWLLPYSIAGLGIGIAILSKGPVGVALPLLIGLVFVTVTKRWRHLNLLGVFVALLIGSLIAAPWFFAIEARQPGFTKHFLITENLGRFSGQKAFHDASPFWFYVPSTILGLLPWTAFFGTAVSALRRDDDTKAKHARWFLWLWAGLIILFFSKSSTKLFSYIVPAFPALSLLLADGILRGVTASKKAVPIFLLVTNLAGAIAVVAFLTDNSIIARDVVLPYAVSGAVVLVASAVFTFRAWNSGDGWRVAVIHFGGAMALYVCLLALAGKIAIFEDSSSMFRQLHPHLRPDDTVIETSSFQPTAIFYLRRPIGFVNFFNTSGLSEEAIAASPHFIKLEGNDVTPQMKKPGRVFVMLRWRRMDWRVPPGTFTWARNNDFKLVCNQPPPPDFRYDFTAPKKALLDTDAAFGPPPVP